MNASAAHRDGLLASIVVAIIALLTALAGIVFRFGLAWRYVADGLTALSVISVLWVVQRQRVRSAMQTSAQIDELMNLLRNAKSELSRSEIQRIVSELQRMQFDVLTRARLRP